MSEGTKLRCRAVQAGDVDAVLREIATAKQKFKVAETVRVVSCYEAGRDGFWLHRRLVSQGIENEVVDSASIEVNRRARSELSVITVVCHLLDHRPSVGDWLDPHTKLNLEAAL